MTLNYREDLEYMSHIEDLIDSEPVQSLRKYVHHHFTNRLEHSIYVSYRSYRWAKRFNLNARAVARAGLLHDLFFYDSSEKDQVGGKGHNYEHPRIALENARQLTEISNLEADIILKHMFGATLDVPKYPESWIVTLVDKQTAVTEICGGSYELVTEKLATLATDWLLDPVNRIRINALTKLK